MANKQNDLTGMTFGKWIAQITCNNKHHCVYCDAKSAAIEARKALADKYFGDFSYSNSV